MGTKVLSTETVEIACDYWITIADQQEQHKTLSTRSVHSIYEQAQLRELRDFSSQGSSRFCSLGEQAKLLTKPPTTRSVPWNKPS